MHAAGRVAELPCGITAARARSIRVTFHFWVVRDVRMTWVYILAIDADNYYARINWITLKLVIYSFYRF